MLISVTVAESETLYKIPGETKYEWEILSKGTLRYSEQLKALRRYEARKAEEEAPLDRYTWWFKTPEGIDYECSVPFVRQPVDVQTEEPMPETPVGPYLKSLTSACIYRWEGWWTYEFCYGKHIRQYHQEQDGKVTAQYNLGLDKLKVEGAVSSSSEYYSVIYTDGTTCSLTDKPREAEVRFYCDPNVEFGILASVKEPSTCHYVVRVDSSLLCKHQKFQHNLEQQNTHTLKVLCFQTPLPSIQEQQEIAKEEETKNPEVSSQTPKPTTTFSTTTTTKQSKPKTEFTFSFKKENSQKDNKDDLETHLKQIEFLLSQPTTTAAVRNLLNNHLQNLLQSHKERETTPDEHGDGGGDNDLDKKPQSIHQIKQQLSKWLKQKPNNQEQEQEQLPTDDQLDTPQDETVVFIELPMEDLIIPQQEDNHKKENQEEGVEQEGQQPSEALLGDYIRKLLHKIEHEHNNNNVAQQQEEKAQNQDTKNNINTKQPNKKSPKHGKS